MSLPDFQQHPNHASHTQSFHSQLVENTLQSAPSTIQHLPLISQLKFHHPIFLTIPKHFSTPFPCEEDFVTFHKDLSKPSYLISLACISIIGTLHNDELSYLT